MVRWPLALRMLVAGVMAGLVVVAWPMMTHIDTGTRGRILPAKTLASTPGTSQTSPAPKTPTPAPKPTSTPKKVVVAVTPAPAPNASTGSGGSGNSSLQAFHCAATPHACGYPDATNTGPVGCNSYTTMTGNVEITDNGAVVNCVKVIYGSFDVYANNVTIQNSIITSRNWWGVNLRDGYNGLKVLHSTIAGDPGNGPDNGGEDYGVSNSGTGIEVGWNNISQFGAAISTGNGNIHDNYGHDNQPFIPFCGNSPCSYYVHSDGFISSGDDTAGLVVRHNTFFDPLTTAMGASASIGLFADDGPVSNTTVDNNLMAGGAYALYPGGGSTSSNIVITGNHFSTLYWPSSGVYGPDATTYWHTGGGNVWSGNVWDDGPNAGQAVGP